MDPQERELLPVKSHQSVVDDITEEVRRHNETLVRGIPQLDLIDYKAMDCVGLPQENPDVEFGGKCST